MMNVLQIPTNGTNIYQSDYSYSVFFDEEKRIIYPPYFRRELSFFREGKLCEDPCTFMMNFKIKTDT